MTPVSRTVLAGMFGLGLGACSTAVAREPEHRSADRPFGDRAVDRTLVVGTLIEATIDSALSWRRAKPGDTLTATVSADVKNARRWVVIPAGCPVGIRVALWDPVADPERAGAERVLRHAPAGDGGGRPGGGGREAVRAGAARGGQRRVVRGQPGRRLLPRLPGPSRT